MAKGVQPGIFQLAADRVAEPAVECGEDRGAVLERERQQRQRARRGDAAERRARHEEFEPAGLHVGKHLRIGAEPALRKDGELERAAGVAADGLGHLGHAAGGRAMGRLVEA